MQEEPLAIAPEPAEAEPEAERVAGDQRSALAEWAVTILLLIFGTATLIQAFVIPTGSMEDNLLIGDHLLVDKLAYAPPGPISRFILPYTRVKRGDIVVFHYPVDIRQTFVKRVVGLPGDHLKLVSKQLFINGKPLDEPYKFLKTPYYDSYRDNFPSPPNSQVDDRAINMLEHHVAGGEVVVPPGKYFVMGDNRDNSLDSRYWGFVPRDNIIGKPLLIYWSYDAPTERLVNSGIDYEHFKDLIRHFFTKTRWNRTFQLIRGYDLNN